MKDAVSNVTFGFLMGQLFPGAVATFALTFGLLAWERRLPGSFAAAVDDLLANWSAATTAHHLFLLGVCIGVGMFIHGLHWSILGAIERDGKASIFSERWHLLPIGLQVLLGPFRMVYEIGLLAKAPDTRSASIHENVPLIDDSKMKQHEFLQAFYLHSSQFFAHTAWALGCCELAISIFVIRYNLNLRRALIAATCYLAIGAFFSLGRIQLCSLFRGENRLKSPESVPYPRDEDAGSTA